MPYKYNRFQGGKHFIDLPRNKRADEVFKLKHNIAKGKYPNFHTYDVLDQGVSWADVYFIGRDKFTLWNATLETAANHRDDHYWSLAWDRTHGALTQEEHDSRPDPFKDGIRLANGYKQLVFNEEPKFDKFEGRTFNEQMDHVISTLTDPVFERIRILPNYRYGIGLEAVLDVPLLTADIIEKFIDGFNTVKDPINFTRTTPAVHVDAPVYKSNSLDIPIYTEKE
jgi:hypothetical protein